MVHKLNQFFQFNIKKSTKQNGCAHLHILAALKRYFPASLVAPLPNSEQINHPISNHTYTKSTPKHIHHHYSPLCNTHTLHLQLHPHTHHIVTPGFVDGHRRRDCTAGQTDGEAGFRCKQYDGQSKKLI